MAGPRENLTPYFDLFDRLGDEDLGRLAGVRPQLVAEVRSVVESIYEPLREYEHLLTTLDDKQLGKLFGMPLSAARIWRLCRAPKSLSDDERRARGVLDEIMGEDEEEDDDDLFIAVEPVESEAPSDVAVNDGDDDWSDL